MSFVIFHMNTDFLLNQLIKYFYKRNLTPLLYFKKICALHCRNSYKHPLFTTLLLVLTVNEVCYISNKYQSPNNLEKHQYFYTRDFICLLHFEKSWHSPSQIFFKTSTFYLFSLVLKNREPYLISKTTLRSPSQNFLETFIFYRIFTSFHSRWGVAHFKQIPAS